MFAGKPINLFCFVSLFYFLPFLGKSQYYISKDDFQNLGYKTLHDSVFNIGDKIIFPGLAVQKNDVEYFINSNTLLINALKDFILKYRLLVFDIEVHLRDNLKSSEDRCLGYSVKLQSEIGQQNEIIKQRLRPRCRGSIQIPLPQIGSAIDSVKLDSLNSFYNNRVELHVTSFLTEAFYQKQEIIEQVELLDVNKVENASKFILAGDYYFMNNEMEKALNYYQIAQRLVPNDSYISKQISLINSTNH